MKILENKKFSELTTFKIGGKIRYYAEVSDTSELREVSKFSKEKNIPIFVLGSGSDVLVSDNDFDGLVVRYIASSIKERAEEGCVLVTAESGLVWDDLVSYAVSNDLQGIECLSGIPGTVGAAPIQNIGAYGQEIENSFVELVAYEFSTDKVVKFTKNDCEFSYRESIFKKGNFWQKYLITQVSLKLNKNSEPLVEYDSLKKYLKEKGETGLSLSVVRNAVLNIRKGKFESPAEVGNAGSFFKNPIIEADKAKELQARFPDIALREQVDGKFKGFAGWFIEKSGWKGKENKGAAVSARHALILVNKSGKASALDVQNLSKMIIDDVEKKFGVRLEPEVQFINF